MTNVGHASTKRGERAQEVAGTTRTADQVRLLTARSSIICFLVIVSAWLPRHLFVLSSTRFFRSLSLLFATLSEATRLHTHFAMLGRLIHFGFDALAISTVLAGVKKTTGFA